MTKEIPLTNGHAALVDDADYERLSAFRWSAYVAHTGAVYARTSTGGVREMQRVVLDPDWLVPGTYLVDHRDGNTLNNQQDNLRFVTYRVSNLNRRLRANSKSGYRGVHYCNTDRAWIASIRVNSRVIRSKRHATAEAAALAYNDMAILLNGPEAKLNEVPR